MFKFDFLVNGAKDEENEVPKEAKHEWFPATKIEPPEDEHFEKLTADSYTEDYSFPQLKIGLKIIRTDKVVTELMMEDNSTSIVEAEKQHSDLIPAKYEGGLKIWECSYDLGNYLLDNDILLKDRTVLDLGCGSGIIGLIALLKGAFVHFQDYNADVIKSVTMSNVYLNSESWPHAIDKCEFYSGDWQSLVELLDAKDKMYDVILTSETIYNPENQKKLFDVFKRKLKTDGIGFVAGKAYYFGVGGSMNQFENLVLSDGTLNTERVWSSEKGLQRVILKLTRKNAA